MSGDWRASLISRDATILEAVQALDRTGLKIVLVVNDEQRLAGVVTDGDIRRGILRNIPLSSPVHLVMNHQPCVAWEGDGPERIKSLMEAHDVVQIPLLDRQGRVVGIESLTHLVHGARTPNWVVIMAGGLGSRLRPLTDDCPKPMLPVAGKPILERIIEGMKEQGFHRFFIAINYLGDRIRDYFGDGRNWGVEISYIEESERMGTAGALSLLPCRPSHPMVVMNGDVLTKLNFNHLLQFHRDSAVEATMCLSEYNFTIPFGVVGLKDHLLTGIEEKPEMRLMVNAGIYVIGSEALDYLPPGEPMDMTTLAGRMLADKRKIAAFPIHEYWLDIGRPTDFAKASEDTKMFPVPQLEGAEQND